MGSGPKGALFLKPSDGVLIRQSLHLFVFWKATKALLEQAFVFRFRRFPGFQAKK
jgi:hypothetical protein